MTIRALLGVKLFRRNSKHVVTLDAYTMEHWLPRRRSFMLRGLSLRLGRFGSHKQILAQQCASQYPWRVRAIDLAAS